MRYGDLVVWIPGRALLAARPAQESRLNASHAAPWVACHGVRSHPVPVALAGECSITPLSCQAFT